MKKTVLLIVFLLMLGLFASCQDQENVQIAATTLPVYEFTVRLCQGTDLNVGRVVTESVSCLHDYSLQVSQMRMLEGAQLVVTNGAGLEDFLDGAITTEFVVDASAGISLICQQEHHNHDHAHHGGEHDHHRDPHIWLSPDNAVIMAGNIHDGLIEQFPEYRELISTNLHLLEEELLELQQYGENTLSDLSYRELITFHDGFAYLAESFDLTILRAVEEESGSEASAEELEELITLLEEHDLPAVFIEQNGSASAADILAAETGIEIFTLDMAMGGDSYFDAMYHNIDTIKEALG